MDAKLLAGYRGKQARPVFMRAAPVPTPARRRVDLLTAVCVGCALVAIAALAVVTIPLIT